MEGILFIPPDRPRRAPEIACAGCGQPFRPRQVADGAEQFCDPCYVAQFALPRHWDGRKPLRLPVRYAAAARPRRAEAIRRV